LRWKVRSRFFDSPPPNLPHCVGPLVRSGTPFALNDSGDWWVRGRRGRVRLSSIRGAGVCAFPPLLRKDGAPGKAWREATADSSTHHPRTYPTAWGPWCVRGPRSLRMTAVIWGGYGDSGGGGLCFPTLAPQGWGTRIWAKVARSKRRLLCLRKQVQILCLLGGARGRRRGCICIRSLQGL
jgi:hypothetical protein